MTQRGGEWVSEPEWDTPLSPIKPELNWLVIGDRVYWTANWRHWMQRGAMIWHPGNMSGQLREFYLVFHIRVLHDGELLCWGDDGYVIRRGTTVVYDARGEGMKSGAITVRAGDLLEVAQWNRAHDWFWGAQFSHWSDTIVPDKVDAFRPYHASVSHKLRHPEGPPLKVFCDGKSPVRTVLAIHSMILNGYAPSEVLLYGEEQWTNDARAYFAETLSFARVVPDEDVRACVSALGEEGKRLAEMSRIHFFVMKLCVALLHPPYVHCLMDDDVFVLRSVTDALAAFNECDLVYQADMEHGAKYLELWSGLWERDLPGRIPTGNFNFGQYWMRNTFDPQWIASCAARVPPPGHDIYRWDQGFIACLFAGRKTHMLSPARYLFPALDGMPGGTTFGYDYENNPSEFISIHFAGLPHKPSDLASALLVQRILREPL